MKAYLITPITFPDPPNQPIHKKAILWYYIHKILQIHWNSCSQFSYLLSLKLTAALNAKNSQSLLKSSFHTDIYIYLCIYFYFHITDIYQSTRALQPIGLERC